MTPEAKEGILPEVEALTEEFLDQFTDFLPEEEVKRVEEYPAPPMPANKQYEETTGEDIPF